MAEGKLYSQATETIRRLCAYFDSKNYNYDKSEDGLGVSIGFSGEDIPMKFNFRAYDQMGRLDLLSFMPFKITEDKMVECALAATVINDIMAGGAFTLDIKEGTLLYKTFTFFSETEIPDAEVFSTLMAIAGHWVEKYNDKFLMLNKGLIQWSDFAKE